MASTIFSGNSRFASDFQQVIERSVSIASLPLSQLNNQKNALQNQKADLQSIDSKVSALQTAIGDFGESSSSTLQATSSDPTTANVHVVGKPLAGSYSIEVVNPGSKAATLSSDGNTTVGDPDTQSITSASNLTLSVGGVTYAVAPTDGSLAALAYAVNTSGAGVFATIVNIGSPTAPDYRLAIQSSTLGSKAIQLTDGTSLFLDQIAGGSPATYRVNGVPSTPIESNSRTVTVAPGLTVDLLKAGTTELTVSHSSDALTTSMKAIVAAYNSVVGEMDKHRGEAKGSLSGQSLLSTLSQSLRQFTSYEGSVAGGINSLTDLGLRFDQTGRLSLDEATFTSVVADNVTQLFDFLGDSNTGFLANAQFIMDSLEGDTDGFLKSALKSIDRQISTQDDKISDNQRRVDLLRDGLNQKMASADAAIAALEQQVNYMNSLFESMKANSSNG
jgi:flagellar hook-associated protein 2